MREVRNCNLISNLSWKVFLSLSLTFRLKCLNTPMVEMLTSFRLNLSLPFVTTKQQMAPANSSSTYAIREKDPADVTSS